LQREGAVGGVTVVGQWGSGESGDGDGLV